MNLPSFSAKTDASPAPKTSKTEGVSDADGKTKADSQKPDNTNSSEQGTEKKAETVKKDDAANNSQSNSGAFSETYETLIKPLIDQYGLYGGIGIGVLILLIVIIKVVSGKGGAKSSCTQCGAKIHAGMTYCEPCSSRKMLSDMEGMAGTMPISGSTKGGTRKTDMKKKVRPSGRVIATITIRKGANPGYKFSFYDSQVQMSIGRDPECDLVLEDEDDREISDRHAVVSMADGNIFTIHDMSNSVGMMVNGEKTRQSRLKSGDVIKISKTELTFARL